MRSLWKGAISFGLIFIPVELFAVEKEGRLDLDLLDKRDFAPVGYQRINKKTGKPVAPENIVKAYEYEDGRYVVLSEEEIRAAGAGTAHTMDLLAFVPLGEIPPVHFEKPYALWPGKGGEKVYVLLHEALRRSGKAGIARLVLRSRQHLVAIVADDEGLSLITLRYVHEIRPLEIDGKPALKTTGAVGLGTREIGMAEDLVDAMSTGWQAADYPDTFYDELLALVEKKVKGKEIHEVTEPEEAPPPPSNVVDLVALLRKSVSGKAAGGKTPVRPAGARNTKEDGKKTDDGKKPARRKTAARRRQA